MSTWATVDPPGQPITPQVGSILSFFLSGACFFFRRVFLPRFLTSYTLVAPFIPPYLRFSEIRVWPRDPPPLISAFASRGGFLLGPSALLAFGDKGSVFGTPPPYLRKIEIGRNGRRDLPTT